MTAYLGAIWKCRYFWMSLVKMDLAARYRGSMLGICWSLLHPIAMTIILCVVFKYGFGVQNMRAYAPMLFTGLTFWGFFSSALVQGCTCFFQGESYIRQFPAPMAIYPLRTVLGAAYHFLIGLALAIVIALLAGPAKPKDSFAGKDVPRRRAVQVQSKAAPVCAIANEQAKAAENTPPAAALPTRLNQLMALPILVPTLLLLLLFGWSVAILFGLLNVRFRDTRHLAEIGLQGLFYLTPIIYPIQAMGESFLGKLLHYNPLTWILDLLIQPILYGRPPTLMMWTVSGLIVFSLMGMAAFALKIEERRLIFHL